MENECIRRDAAEQVICEVCERPGCPILWGDDCDSIDRLNKIPAADVRPVTEISDAVDEALCFLNSVSNEIPYHVYSTLFDRIAEICPGADMREVEP